MRKTFKTREVMGLNRKNNREILNKKYFEDLVQGEHLHCKPIAMTKEAIVGFAEEYDPQPFHTDERAAAQSLFGGLIASAIHVLSACTRSVVEAQGDVAILSGVGLDEMKIYNPVRPGDILTIEAWWTDLKISRSKPDRGFAVIRCKVINQKDEPIMEYGYRYIIACRT
ncbi:MAG TPA: MaoC/PaaZ C-terminal domain-containing protein [Syntrophales bacterium]|nr:MaoC/PaaZ C-terminal domain-containing protein [Syntrophales bacterium]HOX94589.1 MaoC/PaaZ C-terminal domain-containing protein [Syntrophales bacterium]HPI57261.1 MaoC/PaaZ C-terminal domain-containing protein [Syntrophales bacterium]HPN25141.1 MaoC/PaaZ C-terminal domain-containing protein [Syntrophales bacterium]HQM29439.1 MaoC/PaaZ C-terminal domain-containing protein [Syntrophales bacterium]